MVTAVLPSLWYSSRTSSASRSKKPERTKRWPGAKDLSWSVDARHRTFGCHLGRGAGPEGMQWPNHLHLVHSDLGADRRPRRFRGGRDGHAGHEGVGSAQSAEYASGSSMGCSMPGPRASASRRTRSLGPSRVSTCTSRRRSDRQFYSVDLRARLLARLTSGQVHRGCRRRAPGQPDHGLRARCLAFPVPVDARPGRGDRAAVGMSRLTHIRLRGEHPCAFCTVSRTGSSWLFIQSV